MVNGALSLGNKTPSPRGHYRPPAEGGWAPVEEIGWILDQGVCGSRGLKPHKPTLAVQQWQLYGPRSRDIVVTFDARWTYMMTDGSAQGAQTPKLRPCP